MMNAKIARFCVYSMLFFISPITIGEGVSVYARYVIADADFSGEGRPVDVVYFYEEQKTAYAGDFGIISERCKGEKLCMDMGGDFVIFVPIDCGERPGSWNLRGITYSVVDEIGGSDKSYVIRGSGGKKDIFFIYSKKRGVSSFAVADGRKGNVLVQYVLISENGALSGGCVSK